MKKTRTFLFALLALSLLQKPAFASNKKTYVVYLGGHSHGPEATAEDYELAKSSHHELLVSYLGSDIEEARSAILFSYTKSINGFVATLKEEEALRISRHPSVVSVFQNSKKQLHTTRSWSVIEMERKGRVPPQSIWKKADFGRDVIIANIDTGVWPESKSFSDEGMGPIPLKWKGYCENNNATRPFYCNRKLIGARYFRVSPSEEILPEEDVSPRDSVGHGSHTLSTIGGSFVPGANLFGYANGTAKGGSPKSCVATYKACWLGGSCADTDILASFDAAIHDGVDVLSLSLGGTPSDYLMDSVAIGAFHAVMNGITVVCSAGNEGPLQGTVTNIAPWILTVGASTIDRDFPSFVILGNNQMFRGQSTSSDKLPANEYYPLINGADAQQENSSHSAAYCCQTGSLDPEKVKGKIVVCQCGKSGRPVESSEAVRSAGGVGMIVVDDYGSGNSSLVAEAYLLPASCITYDDGRALQSYINSTKSPVGSITAPKTEIGVKPAPRMAGFSSQGPNSIAPQILKPDITAPGENILAAYTQDQSPTEYAFDTRRVPFVLMSGTSMSCPHAAGVAGLIKKLYPDWSPAAIKSAIMTTARTRDNTGSIIKDAYLNKATPLAFGSGHIRPNRAMDPGLVYDLTINDYVGFLCASNYSADQIAKMSGKQFKCPSKPIRKEDLNYPSIAAPDLSQSRSFTVSRTLKNVGAPGTYKVRVIAPFGVTVLVQPETLQFAKVGDEQVFNVTLQPAPKSVGLGYLFGTVIWSDGKHYVRSPLAVSVTS